MSEAFEDLCEQILGHTPSPTSWAELADIAKFYKMVHIDWLLTQPELHIEMMSLGSRPSLAQIKAQNEENKKSLVFYDHILALSLGSMCATIEQREGNFDDPDQLSLRIQEGYNAGVLIRHFSTTARNLVIALKFHAEFPSCIEYSHVVSELTETMFDTTLSIRRDQEKNKIPIRPELSTILTLVKEEIGLLPAPIRKSIGSAMEFNLGSGS